MADLARANDGVDANRGPGLERGAGMIDWRRNLANFANQDWAALLAFLAGGESGALEGRISRTAAHLELLARILHRRGRENIDGDEAGGQEFALFVHLRLVPIGIRNR